MNATQDIFAAVQANDLDRVRRLVQEDPALEQARDADGLPVLLFARYRFLTDAADALLAAHPTLDIFEAAALGRTERVAEILRAHPELMNAYAPNGFLPLGLACFFGHLDTARLLIESGAEVNQTARNSFSVMPLPAAVAGRHHAICELLVARGADVNARHATKDDGQTPADTAATRGHTKIAELIRAG